MIIMLNMNRFKSLDEDGQTLLEIVTAVSILLILTLAGLMSYQGLNDSAKQAAVQKAADAVYDKAYASLLDEDPKSSPKSVEAEYNLSQGGKKDIIVVVQDSVGGDKTRIKVRAMMDNYEAVRITPGSHKGGDGTGETTGPTIPVIDDDTLTNFTYKCDEKRVGYLPILNIGPDTKVYIWENGKKNETFREVNYTAPNSAMIAAGGSFLRSETREEMARTKVLYETNWDWAKMYELVGDWDNKKHTDAQKKFYSLENVVENVSEQIVFESGVSYSIMYDGDVETFAAPGNQAFTVGGNTGAADCLTSIDNLGNSTSLRNILYIGSGNLTGVPSEIPSTVMDLRGAFENSTKLNDSNLKSWDTSNVISMRSTFYNATSFNQDIGNWDTSSLVVAHMTFSHAKSFNQNLSNWNMSNVKFIGGIFSNAKSFNNGCGTGEYSCPLLWETNSLIDFSSAFTAASEFNQEVGASLNRSGSTKYWNTEHVETMVALFNGSASFNNGCAINDTGCPLKLHTSNVNRANNMFLNATSFNQNVSNEEDEESGVEYWDTSKLNLATSMFYGAESFNNGSSANVSEIENSFNWDMSANGNFENFFRGTKSFNQDTKTMVLNNVTKKSNAHVYSGLKCNNIPEKLITVKQCSV